MPRLLQIFARLFIAFPGFLIWLIGVAFAIGSLIGLIRGMHWENALMPAFWIAIAAGCMIIGHLMMITTRILCKDPREMFSGHRLPQRVAWEVGIQATGVLLIAGGIASVHNILIRNWGLLLLSIALFASLIVFYYWISERWNKRRQLWLKELEYLQPSHGSPPEDE